MLVGGLAVLCRLSIPDRVTTDLDTVDHRRATEIPQLQLLVSAGATLSGPFDHACGPLSRDQFESADTQLRADALLHARRWFDQSADRSLSKIRAVPEGRDMDIDDVRLVGDLLVAALTP